MSRGVKFWVLVSPLVVFFSANLAPFQLGRLFLPCVEHFEHEMERGAKQAGVKKIRVHDIRHSAVSLLIDMGFSVLAIGERMGHEAEKITYRYAHLFPTVQTEMAEKLEMERMTKEDTNGKNT